MRNSFGNKGAVAIRIDINKSKFCFINWHLESGTKNLKKRIKQINEFHKPNSFLNQLFDHREFEALKDSEGKVSAFEVFDFVFLSGDLNFRITQKEVVIKNMISKGEYDNLIKIDELHNLRLYNNDLKNYNEHEINFRPSYKYVPRSSPLEYETSKNRMPSYWDRILYKPSGEIFWSRYDCSSYSISDHLCVCWEFEVYVECIEHFADDYRLSIKNNMNILQNNSNTSLVLSQKMTNDIEEEIKTDDIQELAMKKVHSAPVNTLGFSEVKNRRITKVSFLPF